MPKENRWSRRAFLAATGGGLLRGATTGRPIVDVHHHVYPPTFVAGLERAGLATPQAKAWTVEKSLSDMDTAGVQRAIVSMTTPAATFVSGEDARRLARECNEYMAKLGTEHKDRFGVFATLPWPDADASLREIEYVFGTLKADGIGMLTSYATRWFGDPGFAPIFEELNRRKAVVYTHPTSANCCRNLMAPEVPDSAIEYGTDTSRAIAHLVFSGTSQKYPDIRFIFSHAGGTMPFLIERFVNLAKTQQYASKLPKGFAAEAVRFYYDTAQSSNAVAMAALRKVVPVSQIVFGTDYPFRTSAEHVRGLKEARVFSAAELRAIEWGNARRLLGVHPLPNSV